MPHTICWIVYYEYIGMLNDVWLSQYEAALLLHLVAIDRIVWAWKQIRASFCVLTPPLERWSFGIYMSRVLSHRHTRKRLTSKRAHTHTNTTGNAEATQFQERRQRQTAKNYNDAPCQQWKCSTFLSNEHKRVQQFRSDTKPRIHICAGERCLVGEWCM